MARAIDAPVLRRPDLRGLLTRNVPLKVAAVGVALVVWFVLSETVPPDEQTAAFDGKIPVSRANVPAGHVLRGSLGTVEVTVRGPSADLRQLAVSSFQAEVDLSQYDLRRVGDVQELPVQVRAGAERLRVMEIRPSLVAAKLVPVESKPMTVQVRLENQPPAGFQAEQPTVSPGEVTVRGPADALREVVSVVVRVRFADAPNDLAVTPRVVPVDAAGDEVPDVEATPQNVSVSVPVRAATPSRTVGVIPILRGQPAPGYWVAAALADPAVVTVRGDPAALESIVYILTVAIDVTGASADRLVRAALVLPSGTSLARDVGSVQVSLLVRPLSGTRSFPLVAVQATGLANDLVATVTPSSVDVLLAGTVPVLESVRAEQVTATVDLSGKGPGTYELEATVRAPAGVTITLPGGAQISVVVRSR